VSPSEDLSTRRLQHRYLRQLKWQWKHGWWRTDNDRTFWAYEKHSVVYAARLLELNYSHKLLLERGWPMSAKP